MRRSLLACRRTIGKNQGYKNLRLRNQKGICYVLYEGMKHLLGLFGSVLLALALVGCSESGGDGGASTSPSSDAPAEAVELQIPAGYTVENGEFRNESGKLVCPYMNSPVEDDSVVSWVEYEGTKYAMCCPACAKKGKDDPASIVPAVNRL